LNGKNDIVETTPDSVADARGPIQIACPRASLFPLNATIFAEAPRVTLRLFSC
jgi:hypothetical protein